MSAAPTTASLRRYAQKRDFTRTPEPPADRKATAGDLFVVQKHDATRLHYDLRLQVGGVLASWAVPKGPSLDPADKRLAVRTEDHPIDYADFEGVIPKGNYGGGAVIVWDRGTWKPLDPDPAKALKRGKLSFQIDAERMTGAWTLARIRPKPGDDDAKENWLLIKQDDEHASTEVSLTDEHQTSVVTGRTIDEVAAGADPAPKARKKTTRKGRNPEPADRDLPDGAVTKPLETDYSPQLCTPATEAPAGEGWLHEVKYDGYRLLVYREESGQVRIITRGKHDWTHRFKPIAKAVADLPVRSAVIDGEAVIQGPDGHSSFQRLQQALKEGRFDNLAFYAFDLLYLNGSDLTRVPLIDRKLLLRSVIPDEPSVIRYSDHVEGRGDAFHREACRLTLEGIICKKADAPYAQHRSPAWLKVKCSHRQEFVVVGWSDPGGARKHFGSLLLGVHDNGALRYAGRVGTGFDAATLRQISERLAPLARKTCPTDPAPPASERRGAHWVRPEMVVEVEFTQWTDDGRLRHPSFQGVREDKPAAEVRVETPKTPAELGISTPRRSPRPATSKTAKTIKKPSTRRSTGGKTASPPTVAGVRISSPERVIFPEAGLTKADLAGYYAKVAEAMMPHLLGRPLSVVRCPEGRSKACFFQKHAAQTFRDPVTSIPVPEKDGTAEYLAVDSDAGLIGLIQFGVLEIHPWGSTERDLDKPDLLTIDLDPGPDVPWDRVREAALLVREHLESVDLASYLKTSGGKGLHVVVPLKPLANWDEAKAFCAGLARRLARDEPKLYTAVATKSKRTGRVFVDYLRNARGATSVAPYSTRAREGAPVAAPIRWDELPKIRAGNQYDTTTVLRRLARLKEDPWAGFFGTAQTLTAVRRKAFPAD